MRENSRTLSRRVYDERAPRDAGGFSFALSTRQALYLYLYLYLPCSTAKVPVKSQNLGRKTSTPLMFFRRCCPDFMRTSAVNFGGLKFLAEVYYG